MDTYLMDNDRNDSFGLDSLEKMRKRLLDLTGRNRLLNFSHKSGPFVRVIDELPNQLISGLINDRKFSFKALPEPSQTQLRDSGYFDADSKTGRLTSQKRLPKAIEWAQELGFKTHFDVPSPEDIGQSEEKHRDKYIQTLYYPHELESRFRSLHGKAKTHLEETGTNILYLTFGYLEWFEDKKSNVQRLAPFNPGSSPAGKRNIR